MLFKLSIKNIKKSFKDYAIYFVTLILGVAIFYVFNAIESQTVMMDVTASTREIITLMTNMLSGVSVFVSLILGFLIIYASRFLIKRRNKEFGIYLTLGMSKRKISMILFIETLLIGLVSLGVGLGLGVLLSQLMSLLVANMFEADFTKFTFVFSKSACIKTLGYFSIMYIIVMIFNTINVGKCKLIDLLYASKKSEKIKLKNPVICTIVFIVSACFLGYAYYMVTAGVNDMQNGSMIYIPIAIGIITTFLLFWSISGLMLRIVMSMKNLYYKGLNSFILRQVSSKISTAVCQMSIICLMLFVTICVLSASLSIKNSMTANLISLAPADIQIDKKMNLDESAPESGYTASQIEDSYVSISETLTRLGFDPNTYLKDIVEIPIYATNDITIRSTLGSSYETMLEMYPYLQYDNAEMLLSVSDYNRLAELYNLEKITLEQDEYVVVADFDSWVSIRNEALSSKILHPLVVEKYHKYKDKAIPKDLYTTFKIEFLLKFMNYRDKLNGYIEYKDYIDYMLNAITNRRERKKIKRTTIYKNKEDGTKDLKALINVSTEKGHIYYVLTNDKKGYVKTDDIADYMLRNDLQFIRDSKRDLETGNNEQEAEEPNL